jgi:hypothetical protein
MPTERETKAFKRLRKNLSRGQVLLGQFFDRPGGKPRQAGQPKSHEQELLRSVLVLSVGALDAYLSELLIEFLPQLAKRGTDDKVFDRLARDNPGLVLRAVYLGGDAAHEALSAVIEAQFESKVMHGSRAVRQVADWCALGIGNRDFDSEDFPDAFATLDEWTDKRHRIVHRGELVKMRRQDAATVLALVEHIGRALNDRTVVAYDE